MTWREGELPETRERASLAVDDGRFALALDDGVVLGEFDADVAQARLRDAHVIAHDFKSLPRLTMTPAEDTMLAAYLIDPGSSRVRARRPRAGVRARGAPRAGDRRGDGDARAPRRGRAPARAGAARAAARARERGALRPHRAPARSGARLDGGRRDQDRHVPHGRDHRSARGPRRGARDEGARARRRGVHARLDAAGRAHPVREARAHSGAQGQDGLLHRHERAALDPPATTRSSR